jgi:Tol biopolymer transport system component
MGFASASQAPEMWTPDKEGVLMSATLADTRNIWSVPISLRDWKVAGTPQRLTSGTATDVQPSIAGNDLVFASLTQKLDVWSLPVETNRAEPRGEIEKLTTDASAHTYPAVSPDGTRLAFSLQRSSDRDIWIKDLRNGNQTVVSLPPGPSFNPNFSPDGKVLAYRTAEKQSSVGYTVSVDGGGTQEICTDCSDYGWSSDMKKLVLIGKSPARVSILELASKRRTPLLDDAEYLLWNARFSPDDRWILFNATSQGGSRIFVAPVSDGGMISRQQWTAIADSGWDDKPRWSPDGNTIYFVSERDGFRCIWAQPLDKQKRPRGAAVSIFHAHESRRSLSNIGPGDLSMSVARDRIVFNMNERSGNLWMMRSGR